MLLDREDARKLADVIGKKMAQNPEKWRAIAREVGPKTGCSSPFGSGDNLPAPGEAAHALNFMHHAVRGVRPYPENGSGGGGGSSKPEADTPDKESCSYTCIEYEPGKGFVCSREFAASCHPDNPYTCCTFTCDPIVGEFNCFGDYECRTMFYCQEGVFESENGDCLNFDCIPDDVFHFCPSPFHT